MPTINHATGRRSGTPARRAASDSAGAAVALGHAVHRNPSSTELREESRIAIAREVLEVVLERREGDALFVGGQLVEARLGSENGADPLIREPRSPFDGA